MDSLRSSWWSAIGGGAAANPNVDIPADLVASIADTKKLQSDLTIALRNLTRYGLAVKELAAASGLVANDVTQLCTLSQSYEENCKDLITKAAELQTRTDVDVQHTLADQIQGPLRQWQERLRCLQAALEEQSRMAQQTKKLQQHVNLQHEARVKAAGRWTATQTVDLKKAEDMLVLARSKTEGMGIITASSLKEDLTEARLTKGIEVFKEFAKLETQFWTDGLAMCTSKAELITAISMGKPDKKPRRKKKETVAAQIGEQESPDINLMALTLLPDIDVLGWRSSSANDSFDPFSVGDILAIEPAPTPAPIAHPPKRAMMTSPAERAALAFDELVQTAIPGAQKTKANADVFLCLDPLYR